MLYGTSTLSRLEEEGGKGGIDDRRASRRRVDVDSPESEEHGLLKITSGICRLKKRDDF